MSIFVASPLEIYEGAEAERRLVETNDRRFADAEGNVLAVDPERWQQAQQYERATWLMHNLGAISDRNDQHTAGFGGYAALPDDLGDYLEVGCGPFTNSRLILPGHTARSVTLLDPLIEAYEREHPHCAYKGWTLAGHSVKPRCSRIEDIDWDLTDHYDTVVMTNVLSHCQDAPRVFATIQHVLSPGGWLVFAEDVRPGTPDDLYDVGHPLNVRQPAIDAFLSAFDPVYRNGNYFIGRKPGESPKSDPITVTLRDSNGDVAAAAQPPPRPAAPEGRLTKPKKGRK